MFRVPKCLPWRWVVGGWVMGYRTEVPKNALEKLGWRNNILKSGTYNEGETGEMKNKTKQKRSWT